MCDVEPEDIWRKRAQRRIAYVAHAAPVASTTQSEVQLPFHKIIPQNIPTAMIISIQE